MRLQNKGDSIEIGPGRWTLRRMWDGRLGLFEMKNAQPAGPIDAPLRFDTEEDARAWVVKARRMYIGLRRSNLYSQARELYESHLEGLADFDRSGEPTWEDLNYDKDGMLRWLDRARRDLPEMDIPGGLPAEETR